MRSEQEVLKDLKSLTHSDGFLHVIAYLTYHNNFVRQVNEDGFKPEDFAENLGLPYRVIRNEIELLLALMVQQEFSIQLPKPHQFQSYLDKTHLLLNELQMVLNEPSSEEIKKLIAGQKSENPLAKGEAFREPIFYASDPAYDFQLGAFAGKKYSYDSDWILESKGFSIEDLATFVNAMRKLVQGKILQLFSNFNPEKVDEFTVLPAFCFTVEEVAHITGLDRETVDNLIAAFLFPEIPSAIEIENISSFNPISATPIIPINKDAYVLLDQYSLSLSFYQSPAFWFREDEKYVPTAVKNRGNFVEEFTSDRLSVVFGEGNVFKNVNIFKGKNRIAEIDVLVIFADVAIILQAKSKTLTQAARMGNVDAIESDFKKAVQDAYDQTAKCSELIQDKSIKLIDRFGKEITHHKKIREIYPICVTSEVYPSLPHQSRVFLKTRRIPRVNEPYVVDIFCLDVICELIKNPLYFFHYLYVRSRYKERILIETELSIFALYLVYGIYVDNDVNIFSIGEEFTSHLDVPMHVRRLGIPGSKDVVGIQSKFSETRYGKIISQLAEAKADGIFELGYLLLSLGEESVLTFNNMLEECAKLSISDGRVHDFTQSFAKEGLTIHVGVFNQDKDKDFLYSHCTAKKYQKETKRWFGIYVNPLKNNGFEFAIGLNYPWKKDKAKEDLVRLIFPKRGYRNFQLAVSNSKTNSRRKIGRNELCPCGSGKKFKKCGCPLE